MPSADQTKHIRKWIDQDPSLLEALFKDKDFKKRFPDFGDERVLKTKPRDYPIDHPKFDWLRLSGWYVWRPFTKKEFFSPKFHEILIEDWKQILRLNQILDRYTQSWPNAQKEVINCRKRPFKHKTPESLSPLFLSDPTPKSILVSPDKHPCRSEASLSEVQARSSEDRDERFHFASSRQIAE